mmetsp:Transcript_15866/g.24421  ORF Transcript_15866/g.24421 Transcript_15866/m.24421 type:complete len:104 (-) Transcript_15866:108-419(-)
MPRVVVGERGEEEKKDDDDNDDGANSKAEGARASVFVQNADHDNSDSEQLYGTQKATTGAVLETRNQFEDDSGSNSEDLYVVNQPQHTTNPENGAHDQHTVHH